MYDMGRGPNVGGEDSSNLQVRVYPVDRHGMPSPSLMDVKAVFSPVTAIDTGLDRPDLAIPSHVFSDYDILHIKVKIRNHAIYNSTDVHSDQYCARCGNLTDVDDCVFKCHVDAVMDGCKCIPFTFRRLYQNSLPFCTSQSYTNCYKAGNYNLSHCTRENCVPCITTRNSIETTIMQEKMNPQYRLNFEFSGDDKTYAVFQEIYQNSWMGMLGQLGGNLGIFLGFSLLGIWQFAIYVFVYMQRKRKKTKLKKQQNQPHGFLVSWLRLAQLSLETNTNLQGKNGDVDELKKENETLRLDMIKLRNDMENQLNSSVSVLEKRVEILENTIRRIRKRSSTEEEDDDEEEEAHL